MHYSFSVSKRFVLVPILAVMAIQLFIMQTVVSLNMTNAYLQHKCFTSQGKYKPGSVYEKNLKSIIHSTTSTGNFARGYNMMSLGKGPDFASVILQCRGDSYGPKCRSCYATALSQLRTRCPGYKGGIIWYDQCLLEFSGINTKGKVDYDNNLCMFSAKNISGDKDSFEDMWKSLLNNLTSIVINEKNLQGGSPAMYAAGESRIGANKKMYAMVQCTKDLSVKSCQLCVGYIFVHFQNCWYGKQGMRVVGRSCNYRYELYPFVSTNSSPKYLKN